MIVIDTNVVSALMSARAVELEPWLRVVDGSQLFTTAITRAEIRYGIERLPDGRRRDDLSARADALFDETAERILPFDSAAADRYGRVVATREQVGRPISIADAQIAAIALAHRATIATRNAKDFHGTGARVVDPFDPEEWTP